jgi:hypothetical protein
MSFWKYPSAVHIISIEISTSYPCLYRNIQPLVSQLLPRHVGIVEIAKKGHFAVSRSPELGQDAGLRRSAFRTLRSEGPGCAWMYFGLDIQVEYIYNIIYIT